MNRTDLVRVFSVTGSETNKPGLWQYVINTTLVQYPTRSLQLQTVNGYAASLCQRAKEKSCAIAVTWEETAYGPTLRSAKLETEAA